MMRESNTMLAEFVLSQAEMLALLLTTHASGFFALDNGRLIPFGADARRAMTLAGLDSLEQRGLLTRENGAVVLDGTLGLMAGALAYPAVVSIITRDVPGEGQQQILHYRLDPANVELTMPNEQTYRLAALQDEIAALERVRELLPVLAESAATQVRVELPRDEFLRVKNFAEQRDPRQAERILTERRMLLESAATLVQAIAHPILGGTIAFLRVSDSAVVVGKDMAIVQDAQGAWLIRPSELRTGMLSVEAVNPVEYSTALIQAMQGILETEAEA